MNSNNDTIRRDAGRFDDTHNFTINDETASYLRIRDLISSIPRFDGKENSPVDFTDFESVVKLAISRVGDTNTDLIYAIVSKIDFPARAYLDGMQLTSAKEILTALSDKYREWHSFGYYENEIAKMYLRDGEGLDDFNLRLQRLLKNAKATLEIGRPDKAETFIEDLETAALMKFESVINPIYALEVRNKNCRTVKEAYSIVKDMIKKARCYSAEPRGRSRYERYPEKFDDRRDYRHRDKSEDRRGYRDYRDYRYREPSRDRYREKERDDFDRREKSTDRDYQSRHDVYRGNTRTEVQDRFERDTLYPMLGAMKELLLDKWEKRSQCRCDKCICLSSCSGEELEHVWERLGPIIRNHQEKSRSKRRPHSRERS